VSAEKVAWLATRGGADILGRDETGSIEVGKAADVIAMDLSRLGYAGAFSDPLAAIVYAGLDHRVDYTIVNGEIVVEERRLVNGDEEEIAVTANEASVRMLELAGVETPWPMEPPRHHQ
jgi:cytosine/adenosine deaminase-related metal-dependent hydrolase